MIKITTEWTKRPLFFSVCSCQTLYQAMQLSRLSNAPSGLFSEVASTLLLSLVVWLSRPAFGRPLSTPPGVAHPWA